MYIEGDGRAFISRRRISDNPTPADPVALKMAAGDPSPAVAYIARPCQFTEPLPDVCRPRYWTSHRYADAVITAISQVIDTLRRRSGIQKIGLVGYSGGGTVAALLAGRRDDVDWLVTVAANLDHAAWTAWHDDTPLDGSLNPADQTERLAAVPQLHIAGAGDATVPPELTRRFVRRLPARTPVDLMVVEDADHHDWPAFWRRRVGGLGFWQARPAGITGS